MDLARSKNGEPSYLHFTIAIIFAIGFFPTRFILDRLVFRRLAAWMLCSNAATLKVKENQKGKLIKCTESMWKLTYYATVEICILTITFREPWFKEGQGYFSGWPKQELKVPLQLFYMCQFGFYIYSIVALLTWETRRTDFPVMMSHHVVTVILIALSCIMRFLRIGSIVLALHDASDVFLEAAKILNYSGYKIGASLLFGCFAISWLILRLIIFPFSAIKATCFDLCDYLSMPEVSDAAVYYVSNTMLMTLLVFNMYWFKLICETILRQLKMGKVGEDIRSDSEDDDSQLRK